MALYQIIISYDGTEFHGYQRQIERRVQFKVKLKVRLEKLNWLEKQSYHQDERMQVSCGRTGCCV